MPTYADDYEYVKSLAAQVEEVALRPAVIRVLTNWGVRQGETVNMQEAINQAKEKV